MSQPALTFFCELTPEPLTKLFDGRFVIDDLKSLHATLSLGILDFSDERADLVKRLNKAGIPVIGWLLLPEEEGYWFNVDNHEKAAARYVAFKAWTTQHDLHWAGIGLDIEMDINDLRAALSGTADKAFAKKILHRLFDKARVIRAQRSYQALVDLIHADGYPVESYHLPLMIDERQARSTVIQRALGLVDIDTDREVLMLYTSMLTDQGDAVLWSYAPEADSVGVGNTGGGVDLADTIELTPLTWDAFTRDLRLCVMLEKPIHIFSLEGCVEQGFLSKLNTLDWDEPAAVPDNVTQVEFMRKSLRSVLWILERPWVILIGLGALIGLGFLFIHTGKSRQKN